MDENFGSSSESAAHTVVLHSPSDRIGAWFFAVFGVIMLIGAWLVSGWHRAFFLGGFLLFEYYASRCWRARLSYDATGVTATRFQYGVRRLSWDEVQSFEFRGSRRGVGAWTGPDNSWVTLLNYGSVFRGEARQVVDQLNAMRADSVHGPAGSDREAGG